MDSENDGPLKINDFTVLKLRDELKRRNLSTNGKKVDLFNRLVDSIKKKDNKKKSSMEINKNLEEGQNGQNEQKVGTPGGEKSSTAVVDDIPLATTNNTNNGQQCTSSSTNIQGLDSADGQLTSGNNIPPSPSQQAMYRNRKGRSRFKTNTNNMQPANYEHLLKKIKHLDSFIFDGAKTFKELIDESTVFVDRTLFLEELMEGTGKLQKGLLLCLPTGVGKTTILTMCKFFFERPRPAVGWSTKPIQISQDGPSSSLAINERREDELKKMPNHHLFSQSFEYNRHFKIMEKDNFFKTHFGRYPTLLLDLSISCDVQKGDDDDIEGQIGKLISDLYKENKYLRELMDEDDQFEFDNFRKGPIKSGKWKSALEMLTDWLYKCHNEKTIILVDNYDFPILNEKDKLNDSGNWRRNTALIRNFVHALEKAPNVLRLLIFGNYRFQMNTQSHLHYYGVDNDQNSKKPNPLLTYFGFSQKEFDELCDSYHFMDPENRAKATRYYNGYCINQIPLFNTSSIMKLLNNWITTGDAIFDIYFKQHAFLQHFVPLFQADEIKEKILLLTKEKPVKISEDSLKKPFTEDEIKQLLQCASNLRLISSSAAKSIEPSVVELFLRLLLNTGLLCRRGNLLQIPNGELIHELNLCLVEHYFVPKYHFNLEEINELAKTLEYAFFIGVDAAECKQKLTDGFGKMLNSINKGKNRKAIQLAWSEHLMHVFSAVAMFQMRGWSYFASDYVLKKTQKRPDLIICSNQMQAAVCIELKFGEIEGGSKAGIERTPEYALFQIFDRKYISKSGIDKMEKLDLLYAVGINARFETDDDEKENNEDEEQPKILVDVEVEFRKNGNRKTTKNFCLEFEQILLKNWKQFEEEKLGKRAPKGIGGKTRIVARNILRK